MSLVRVPLCVLCLLASGCASGPDVTAFSRTPEGKPMPSDASPELLIANRLSDHYEWIKRLQVAVPDEQYADASDLQSARIPIPVAPQVGQSHQYLMAVDHGQRIAWLHRYGPGGSANKVFGPWSVEHPDVAHILHSLSNPPGMEIPKGVSE